MHPWAEAFHACLKWGALGAEVIAFLLVPAVLLRKKEPASTAAWILTLVFLPALGALLFLFFGRERVRMPVQRKRDADARVRAKLPKKATDDAAPLDIKGSSELEQSLFRVAAKLTHVRARAGNKVTLLAKGTDAFDALFAAIDAAKSHVHAEYYLIRNDTTGHEFRDRLAKAAERGVHVRLLVDGFGSFGVRARFMRPLKKAGGQVARFLPMRSVLLQPINLRDHRKIVVIDGHVAFTGGLNVGDEYRGGTMRGVGSWKDIHLRVEGPSAADLQRIFLQDWSFAHGEVVDPGDFFPVVDASAGGAAVAIVPSGPDATSEAIHHLFFGAICGARERVRIITPYFVPDRAIVVALGLAAMRGVRVEMIFPAHSNHQVTFHAGRSFYDELLRAGVAIYEYQPGIVHAKVVLVDGRVCLVGSANMDMRSFRLNFEVHTLVHDDLLASALGAELDGYLAQCKSVELATWEKRSAMLRFREGASRLVSPLL